MSTRLDAREMLDREFLEIRCRILDVAAALDRISGATGSGAVQADPRLGKLRTAATVLTDGEPDRARRVQMVFSDPYEASR